MRFIAASALSFCFVPAVLSSAIPIVPDTSPAPDKRVFPLTAPQRDVVCLGYTVPVSDILAAINQGAAWATTDPLTKMGASKYPHPFNNHERLSFPDCAGSPLMEYPVLRYGSNPWVPGKNTKLPANTKEPDRVIFVATSPTSVTYCGVITHDATKMTDKGKLGAFVSCTY